MWQKIKELFGDRKNQWRYFRWLISLSKPFAWQIIFIIFLRCAIAGVGIVSAAINKNIVDWAQDAFRFKMFIAISVGCTVISLAASVFFSILSTYVSEKYSCYVRTRLYNHIMKSLWVERGRHHSEDFMTRLTNDISVVANGIMDIVATAIATILQFIMAFGLLWHYDSSLAVVGLATAPVIAIVAVVLAGKLGTLHKQIQEAEAKYRIFIQEQFNLTDTVKVFEQEQFGADEFVRLQEARMKLIRKRNYTKVIASAIISAVFSGTYLFAFCTGAMKINAGVITFGTMTAFLSLIHQVQTPMYRLANLLPQGVAILASAGRLMKITGMKTEKKEKISDGLSGNVGLRAEKLCLSYGEALIVDGLDMEIKPGELVMVKGSSGVGKTTLIRSILGFISPNGGKLVFFDESGREIPCSPSTREYISYVPQGNTLFSGTIADNLRMGKRDATREEMQHALEIASAWEFVSSLTNGLDTVIGERGLGFSEGQAQRIAIARAFLKPAGIIIMDEATSALDVETEEKILAVLKDKLCGKSCLFVSHRESVSRVSDKVITVKNKVED